MRASDLAEPPGRVSWPVASPDPHGGPRGRVPYLGVTVSDVYHMFELGLLVGIVLTESFCTMVPLAGLGDRAVG